MFITLFSSLATIIAINAINNILLTINIDSLNFFTSFNIIIVIIPMIDIIYSFVNFHNNVIIYSDSYLIIFIHHPSYAFMMV